jgi:hypothetical protein
VTRIVTFRRWGTQASPCSSVWQNGDAGLATSSEQIADRTGFTLVADGRLEAVDAASGRIGGDDVLLQPLEFGGVARGQEAPFGGGAGLCAEGT